MPTLDEINSAAYQEQLRRQAEQQLAPTRDIALSSLDINEQEIARQEAEARRQNDLANLGLNQQETTLKRQSDTLAQTLQEQAQKSGQSLQERFNQLGLLQSGMTAAGLGDVQKTLAKGVAENEADKASRLAQLALERAGLTGTLTSSLANYGLQRQTVGLKRQEAQQNYAGGINELVSQLVEGARQSELQRIDAQQKAASAKAAAANPFAGLLGGTTTAPKAQPAQTAQPTTVPLNEYFKSLFDQGQYVQGTEEFADALSKATTIGGAANPYLGMTKDQILEVAYQVRKPYETQKQTLQNTGYVSPTSYFGMRG
jgi:hypothetical protein